MSKSVFSICYLYFCISSLKDLLHRPQCGEALPDLYQTSSFDCNEERWKIALFELTTPEQLTTDFGGTKSLIGRDYVGEYTLNWQKNETIISKIGPTTMRKISRADA